ncbi:RNAse III [Bryocella elongata]|uniref:Ribonuclease 3 n=1 Tax=Bryocella elongata TaxID=863522 RepID=A0A1H6BSQ3_9BACT|nr:ribonuclease III [Bryocella elongata]SEG63216.1 RNAse III [Bryocella elongata]
MSTRKRKAEPEPTPTDTPPSRWAELEDRLEYRFRRPELIELALTHRSFPYEGGQTAATLAIQQTNGWREPRNVPGTDNEQLEFLGDAVLGLMVTEALFSEFQQCGEGDLTRLRASLVSRKRMAEMGEQLDLGKHLLLGRSAELNGIRKKPTVLANAAEAIIAAMYLDASAPGGEHAATAGFGPVRRIVERYLLGPERENLHRELEASGEGRALRDHKTLLQERVQAAGSGKLKYVDIGESGPAHQKRFAVEAHLETDDGVRILASAEGPSKKEAQQRAAALALEELGPAEVAATRGVA